MKTAAFCPVLLYVYNSILPPFPCIVYIVCITVPTGSIMLHRCSWTSCTWRSVRCHPIHRNSVFENNELTMNKTVHASRPTSEIPRTFTEFCKCTLPAAKWNKFLNCTSASASHCGRASWTAGSNSSCEVHSVLILTCLENTSSGSGKRTSATSLVYLSYKQALIVM